MALAPPIRVGDLDLEPGPDALTARKPWGADLCRELGLPLVAPATSGAFLWTETGLILYLRDRLRDPGRRGRRPALAGLSRGGRFRALGDLVKRGRRDGVEETLGGLLRRRLGDEATDRSIAPLLAGLHAGDVDRLSAAATFPELIEWEQSQGSDPRRAGRGGRRAARMPARCSFARGRGCERSSTRSSRRSAIGSGPEPRAIRADDRRIELATGAEPCDAVVLAGGAAAAASVLGDRAPDDLRAMRAVSTGVVFLVYPSGTAAALPDGSGAVVPRGRAPMTAATFLSRKWPDDRFGDRAVLRCFVGGDGDEDVLDANDADIVEACGRHLAAALDLPGEPEATHVHRWWRGCPSTSSATSIASDGSGRARARYLRRGERLRRRRRVRIRAPPRRRRLVSPIAAVPRKEPA